nr:sigma factor [Pseudosphingobacterium sp.]
MFGSTLEELFQRTKAGDSVAFTALYRHTWQKLYQLALRKTQSDEEAKDIVQEIYIQLWQKKESIDIRGSVEA